MYAGGYEDDKWRVYDKNDVFGSIGDGGVALEVSFEIMTVQVEMSIQMGKLQVQKQQLMPGEVEVSETVATYVDKLVER